MGNKENMRQAMKELLGLVGIGPDADKEEQKPQEQRAEREAPAAPADSVEQEHVSAVDLAAQQRAIEEARIREEQRAQEEARAQEERQEVTHPVKKSFFGSKDSGFGRRKEEPMTDISGARREEGEDAFASIGAAAPTRGEISDARPFVTQTTTTIIAAGTSMFGDVRSEGEVEVQGKLKGNLEATGSVRITGKVLGDVKGDAVDLVGCAVQGNVTATSTVRIDAGTVVVGDIIAGSLISDGKMKGNVQVEKTATFQRNAVLAGNVIAALVSISEGAKIQGAVRISQDQDTNALFDEELDI